MKITGLEIGEYRQFKNIKFDFTYPEGHVKAGQPLDKVCFIGQSGTGKTTLLNIVWDFFKVINTTFSPSLSRTIFLNKSFSRTFQTIKIQSIHEENKITLDNLFIDESLDWADEEQSISRSSNFLNLTDRPKYNGLKNLIRSGCLCLYIDEAAVSSSKNLLEEREIERELVSKKDELDEPFGGFDIKINTSILGLSDHPSELLWATLLGEIDTYDNDLKQFAANLVSRNSFSRARLINQISQWQKEHPNPRADLAENCLNQILHLFHLEVDTEGTESRLVLKTKKGEHIGGKYLSTGAKQLIATSIPIYKTNVSQGVVLFDEPERSLFPDIQRELIAHYTSLAPTAQFFFATHSPIIASAFEPCERFILYFDENGEVKFRNGTAPEGDDPNDILSEDFGLTELMLPKGLEAYDRYRNLGVAIRNEKDPKRKEELIAERAQLGDSYKF